jgi:hypothetical protein
MLRNVSVFRAFVMNNFEGKELTPMPTVDDSMRRYEDLTRRAADLRSYL